MMESCSNSNWESEPVYEDLRKDLCSEFSALQDTQDPTIQDQEHLKVFLRIRPFTSSESGSGESQDCVSIEPPDTILLKPPRSSVSSRLSDKSLPQTGQRFQFSQVYGPGTSQRELFDGTVKDLIRDVLKGGNSLVFTYGVTNAGKTFTFLGTDVEVGILPRSLNMIFSSIKERIYKQMIIKPMRCHEFIRLTREQQVEETICKRNFFRQLREVTSEKSSASLLCSTSKAPLAGSTVSVLAEGEEEGVCLELEAHTMFSVWVSFCEIYNENIHDLLEPMPSGAQKRTVLRLSQDVKGNAFVKDLRWVQVNSAEEAYMVMMLGKRNQSFSSTKLNHLSSRSHSIFSIRILRIEDTGIPRVIAISELSLCDLAGSERCAKTQNKGERLKEAGNINTSLLILGKCISALRHNQQAKLLQHVPFRESKLTHYLQSFFCGRGKACMIVNINQCASVYDETLNVLKFSSLAQKVVVLPSKTIPIMPQRSAYEVSLFINNADRKTLLGCHIGLEKSLEEVQEDEGSEDNESPMEDTVQESGEEEDGNEDDDDEKIVLSKGAYQRQMALLQQLKEERIESMLLEARVREEVTLEFSELFSKMQNDNNNRLAREKEILVEQSERRLEIFKDLVKNLNSAGPSQDEQAMDKDLDLSAPDSLSSKPAGIGSAAKAVDNCPRSCQPSEQAGRSEAMEELEKKVSELLNKLRNAQEQLTHKTTELDSFTTQAHQYKTEMEETKKSLESREQKLSELMELCLEKDKAITRLQTAMERQVEDATKNEELLSLKSSCSCSRAREVERPTSTRNQTLKRQHEAQPDLDGQPPPKRDLSEDSGVDEEVVNRLYTQLQEKCSMVAQLERRVADLQKEIELTSQDLRSPRVRRTLHKAEEEVDEEAEEAHSQEEALDAVMEEDQGHQVLVEEKRGREQALYSLEGENRAMEEAQPAMEEVAKQTAKALQVSDELQIAQAQMEKCTREIQEKMAQIHTLTQEVEHLKQELYLKRERKIIPVLTGPEMVIPSQSEEFSGQSRVLAEEKEENKTRHGRIPLLRVQVSDQPLQQLTDKLKASEQELGQSRSQPEEQTQTMEKQQDELGQELREQEVVSVEEVDRIEQISQLRAKSEEAVAKALGTADNTIDSKAQDDHFRLDVGGAELGAKATNIEEKRGCAKDRQMGENTPLSTEVMPGSNTQQASLLKAAEMVRLLKDQEKELQEKLARKEAQVLSLQKRLQQAVDRSEEEESQAVQEARRREVERRRELLAVAEEAIAQKDAELEKRAQEIQRLKESAIQGADKVKTVCLDLQRKEDETSDLREKLADSKKQIQQVQKEISTMRDEEKTLKQKLSDAEKTRKQLQFDLANRDRTIQLLKTEKASDAMTENYRKTCKDLEATEHLIADMRLALMEQEETQEQMERFLEEKEVLVQELRDEINKLKGMLQVRDNRKATSFLSDDQLNDLSRAKEEAAKAAETLKLCTEKHQADRRKWLEEKMSLIGQAKRAEETRNQEMRKFADERERHARQQTQLESVSSQLASVSTQLAEKEQAMEQWRHERDSLVAALEVQLQKLLSSNADKEKVIQELRSTNTQPPQEGSFGCPTVLDSSEISTENGRTSRFPKPELEISFSPLQPNRMALRRQGEENTVTVKITRSARKRKSAEMDKEEVEAENRWNTRSKVTPKLIAHQEEGSSPVSSHDTQSSEQGKKEGTLQKIGDFLQSSPTLLGTKAKKMMGLVSGRCDVDPGTSSFPHSLRVKKSKKKLYRPEISSPMDMPSHPIISTNPVEKESDHLILKRCLRTRTPK
ncbi:kinesin-like protein KIF20B [Lampris incognitus]|uniref:kinesin-like protein KIF20B n=1 Tax=Lampris incognitus TaxID=2546036 RepID=UPI0024B57580|nr:kinesin-like protein KIF20B [Lampris incognitus]